MWIKHSCTRNSYETTIGVRWNGDRQGDSSKLNSQMLRRWSLYLVTNLTRLQRWLACSLFFRILSIVSFACATLTSRSKRLIEASHSHRRVDRHYDYIYFFGWNNLSFVMLEMEIWKSAAAAMLHAHDDGSSENVVCSLVSQHRRSSWLFSLLFIFRISRCTSLSASADENYLNLIIWHPWRCHLWESIKIFRFFSSSNVFLRANTKWCARVKVQAENFQNVACWIDRRAAMRTTRFLGKNFKTHTRRSFGGDMGERWDEI